MSSAIVFSNPSSDQVFQEMKTLTTGNISTSIVDLIGKKEVDLFLFNHSGKKVKHFEQVASGSKRLFDVVPGTYQLKIVNTKGFTIHKIIIL